MKLQITNNEHEYTVYQYSVSGIDGQVDGKNYEFAVSWNAKNGRPVELIMETVNGKDVFAVYVKKKRLFILWGTLKKIGYLNQRMSDALSKKIHAGGKIMHAEIRSFFIPDVRSEDKNYKDSHKLWENGGLYNGKYDDPVRVSIIVECNWITPVRKKSKPREQWLPS